MVKYEDLKKLASLRLKEAKALYSKKLYDGSAYLCGYVVELALKARICKHLKLKEYPEEKDKLKKATFMSHDLDWLLLLAGLSDKITPTNSSLFKNWSIINPWRPDDRYDPVGTHTKPQVELMLHALCDEHGGIYKWLRRIW